MSGKLISIKAQWSTSTKKQEGAEVDAKKSMEKAANIGDMMAYKKFKAQLWLEN